MGRPTLWLLKRRNNPYPRFSSPGIFRSHFLLSYSTRPGNNFPTLVTEAVYLLRAPHGEWDPAKLNRLLFPDAAAQARYDPPPGLFYDIALRLPSSTQALHFLRYLRDDSPCRDHAAPISAAFNAAIELACREGPDPGSKVLGVYKACIGFGIPLTFVSAAVLIRALGRIGLVEESVNLFGSLEKSVKNTHVYNVFVEVLLSSGRKKDALKLLDEMLQLGSEFPPDSFTWDVVFRSGMKGVSEEEMVRLVLRFGESGVFPSPVWLTQVITKMCLRRKAGVASDLVCGLMKLLEGRTDVSCCNALLSGLGKMNDIGRMKELMAKMEGFGVKPNKITCGIYMKNLCKCGMVDEALEELGKMTRVDVNCTVGVEPDVVIYNTLIDGLCKVGRNKEGLDLMRKMKVQDGRAPNVITYNCLINGFCKASEIEKAKELFDEMEIEGILPDRSTFNCLIHGMCLHERTNTAFNLFRQMQSRGLKVDSATFTPLVTAFCSTNNIDNALEIFNQMQRDGCTPDAIAYYSLLSGLSQAGRMDDACAALLKMKDAGFFPDLKCYNTLISGLCKTKKLDKAYEMIMEMEEAGLHANHVTYNILISHFGKAGDLNTVHRLLERMTKENLVPTDFTYGSLMNAYCLHDDVDEAMKILEGMETAQYAVEPNTVMYNILIDYFGEKKEVERALSLMDRMKLKGVRPNTTTYNSVLKGLQAKNMLDTAFKLMDEMIENECIPNFVTLEILTEWFSAAGETDRLKDFVQGFVLPASASSSSINLQGLISTPD